jgi:hypothetical protein
MEHLMKPGGCQRFIQRFRSQLPGDGFGIGNQPDAPKLAGIIKRQADAIRKVEDSPVMRLPAEANSLIQAMVRRASRRSCAGE